MSELTLPSTTTNWRENNRRLAEDTQASPLPTRQLKRMAARALARTLAQVKKREDHNLAKVERKRRRAAKAKARADERDNG